jgi:ubiquitin C-terminal hydrolase
LFCAPEEISDYYCHECQCQQNSSKILRLREAPEVLILTLKRFNGIQAKNDNFVDFPLNDLDMAPYFATDSPPLINGSSSSSSSSSMYHLYAVVQHIGGLHNGHYTASCL